MIEIRICPETPAELQTLARLLTDLSHGDGLGQPANCNTETAQTKPAARRGRRKTKVEPAEATAAPAPQAIDEVVVADAIVEAPAEATPDGAPGAEDLAPTSPGHSHQQVVDALQGFARSAGHLALRELLDRFGARRASQLRPEHYAEVMAAIGERAAA